MKGSSKRETDRSEKNDQQFVGFIDEGYYGFQWSIFCFVAFIILLATEQMIIHSAIPKVFQSVN